MRNADPFEQFGSFRARLASAEAKADARNLEIVVNAEFAKQSTRLERAGDAHPTNEVGLRAANVAVAQQHASGSRRLEPSEDVDKRRLAGAVGTNQARDPPSRDIDSNVRQSAEPVDRKQKRYRR